MMSGRLMIVPIRFPALPQPTRQNLRTYRWRFVGFLAALVMAAVAQERGLLLAATIYLLLGVVGALVYAARIATADEDDAGDAPGVEAEPVALASPDVPPRFPDARS